MPGRLSAPLVLLSWFLSLSMTLLSVKVALMPFLRLLIMPKILFLTILVEPGRNIRLSKKALKKALLSLLLVAFLNGLIRPLRVDAFRLRWYNATGGDFMDAYIICFIILAVMLYPILLVIRTLRLCCKALKKYIKEE